MRFTRLDYKSLFDFAEEVFLLYHKTNPQLAFKAKTLIDMVENVIGQQRCGDETMRLDALAASMLLDEIERLDGGSK